MELTNTDINESKVEGVVIKIAFLSFIFPVLFFKKREKEEKYLALHEFLVSSLDQQSNITIVI